MKYKIPFEGRAHNYTEHELAVIQEAVLTAVPLTQGRYRNEFEAKFCKMFGCEFAFAVSNATADA